MSPIPDLYLYTHSMPEGLGQLSVVPMSLMSGEEEITPLLTLVPLEIQELTRPVLQLNPGVTNAAVVQRSDAAVHENTHCESLPRPVPTVIWRLNSPIAANIQTTRMNAVHNGFQEQGFAAGLLAFLIRPSTAAVYDKTSNTFCA